MLYSGLFRRPDSDARKADSARIDWPRRFQDRAAEALDPRLRAFYAAGVVSGDTPVAEVPLVALDIETTGLDPVKDGIVSIGLVPMHLTRIFASRSRHWILKPRVPLAEKSVTIHGITDSQIESAPDLAEVLGEVLQALAGQVLVVHCRDIERQFLDRACRSRIGEAIEFPVVDTMELEARLYRRRSRGLLSWLSGEQPPSIRLAASRTRYGLPRYRPHHALNDALASAELLQAQVAHRFSPETPIAELWS